jgi:hypothetical protein
MMGTNVSEEHAACVFRVKSKPPREQQATGLLAMVPVPTSGQLTLYLEDGGSMNLRNLGTFDAPAHGVAFSNSACICMPC